MASMNWSSSSFDSLSVGSTRNGEGREVAMTAKVAELLREATAGKAAEDFVLTREGGKPIKDFRLAWENLTTRAGLPNLLVHDLRRSAAKALRAAGVPESVVMSIGGWKTPAMFRRYAIVSTADQRAAVEKLERARAENSPDFGSYSTKMTSASAPAEVAKCSEVIGTARVSLVPGGGVEPPRGVNLGGF